MSETSLEELKYHFLLARDLKYLEVEAYKKTKEKLEEVGRLISGLIKSL